jgi:hypothetical protein
MVSRAERHRREKQAANAKGGRPAPKPKRDRGRVIANVHDMLAMARNGLADASGSDPQKRRAGLMNLATWGRSVTLTMQTMTNVDPGFVNWYEPHLQRMRADPLMQYFTRTRNSSLKEGEASTAMVTSGAFTPELNKRLAENQPPNAIDTFIGETRTGGNGWHVQMPDGSIGTVYFDLADDFVQNTIVPLEPPHEHYGEAIADTSVANLGRLYIETLTALVNEFVQRFSK